MDDEERWNKASVVEEISDEVFKEIYIPRTLQEVEEVRNSDEIFKNLTGVSRKVKKENESFDDITQTVNYMDQSEDR